MPIVTFNAIADAYYDTEYGLAYGHEAKLVTGIGPYAGMQTINYISKLKFDASSLPKCIRINSAILKMYLESYSGVGSIGSTSITVGDSGCDEDQYTDYNVGKQYGYYLDYRSIYSSDVQKFFQYELKDHIQNSYNNGNTNINLMFNPGATDYNTIFNFASREHADSTKRPVMIIDYTIMPPSQPSDLFPSNGFAKNILDVVDFSWKHNPYIASTQSKFDLQWRAQGTSIWNSITQTTANQFYQFAANAFPRGYIEWQVKTYDINNQASPWSAIALFYVAQKPPTPTITSPANNAELTSPTPSVTWTALEQADYNLQVLDSNNVLVWETVKTSQDKVKQIEYALENNSTYKLRVRIKNADNYWSDFSQVTVTTKYVDPPAPTVTSSQDKERGSIILNIANDEANMPQKVKVGLKGRTVINLLGSDGDCESVGNWITDSSTANVVDSSNKVFGNNSLKLTTDADGWNASGIIVTEKFDRTKYYCLSGYIKNATTTGARIRIYNNIEAEVPQSTSKIGVFERVFIKYPANYFSGGTIFVGVVAVGGSGSVAYLDGLMLNEITQAEYNDANYVPPEYVNNNVDVVNPTVKAIGKNLFNKNTAINGYYDTAGIYINTSSFKTQLIKVKKNTAYTFSNASYNIMFDEQKQFIAYIPSTAKTYTTTINGYIAINVPIANIDIAMLEEGSVATTYEPYKESVSTVNATLRRFNGTYDEITQDGKLIRRIGYDVGTKTYSVLATPVETNISPITIDYFQGGTVQAVTEVVPEITISAPVPAYYSNEVYRRKQGETIWTRIKKLLQGNTPFEDYSPAHAVNYEYKVRTILDTKAYADSAIITASAIVNNSQIALVNDYSKWVMLKHNPSKSRRKGYSRQLAYFAGREYPVAEFTPQREEGLSLAFTVYEEELDKLYEIIDKMQTVLFRDSRGRCIFGTVGAIETDDDITFGYYIVKLTVDRVDYIEGV